MKIFAITDIHGNLEQLKRITEKIKEENPDLILIAGDITNFEGKEKAKEILNVIKEKNKPFYFVPGNCDVINDYDDEINKINLHGKAIMFRNVAIIGLGGSNITPFSTPFELNEKEIEEILTNAYEKIKGKNYKKLILLSHTPPYNCNVDKTLTGSHIGSKGIRKFVEKYSPDLIISGHAHDSKGKDSIKKTKLVNPGPAFLYNYATIKINKEIEIQIKSI